MSPRPDLLTQKEAATYMRVSLRWLEIHRRDGPVPTKLGGKVYYLKADLDGYIEGQRQWRDHGPVDSTNVAPVAARPGVSAATNGAPASTSPAESRISDSARQIANELSHKLGENGPSQKTG